VQHPVLATHRKEHYEEKVIQGMAGTENDLQPMVSCGGFIPVFLDAVVGDREGIIFDP